MAICLFTYQYRKKLNTLCILKPQVFLIFIWYSTMVHIFIPCYSLGVGKLVQKKSFAKSKITSDLQNQFVYNIWQGLQVLHKFTYSTLKHNKIHWSLLGFCWLASLQKYEQCVGKVVQIRSSKCSFLRVAQCLDRWNSAVEWHWPDFLETNLLAFWSVLFVQQASLWHMVNWTVDSHHRLH